jgi:tetratricopeptide (TPR) repeat protein
MSKVPKRTKSYRRRDRQQKILEIFRKDGQLYLSDVCELKAQPINDLKMALGRLQASEISNSTVLRNIFPQNLNSLGRRILIPMANTLDQEILWLAAICSTFYSEVNEFLDQKRSFERLLFGSDFAGALNILDSVERRFGLSLWLIESKFAVAQLRGGFQENRSLLADIRQNCDDNFLLMICQFLSQRAEEDVSRNHLNLELQSFHDIQMAYAAKSNDESISQAIVEFVKARIDFHWQATKINLQNFLHVASVFSLVDQYLALSQVLQHQFLYNEKSAKRALCDSNIEQIDDTKLLLMKTFLDGRASAKALGLSSKALNKTIEYYTRGDYNQVQKRSVEAIKVDASCLENYELLVKSSLYLQSFDPSSWGLNALATKIVQLVHDALARTQSSAQSLHLLMKEGLRVSSSSFADQTIAFFYENRVSSNLTGFRKLSVVNVAALTPRIVECLSDRSEVNKLLQVFDQNGPSTTALLFRSTSDGMIVATESTLSSSIPETRLSKFRGVYLESQQKYDEAIAQYQQVWNDLSIPAYQQSDVLGGLYRCLMALVDYDRCASIIVDGAIRNPGLLINVQLYELLSKLKGLPSGNLHQIINRALVFWIAATFDYRLWEDDQVYDIAEDLFIKLRLRMPSDLVGVELDVPIEKLNFFLQFICVPSVLCSWPAFSESGTEGVENERIKILEYLRKQLPEDQESFSNEIAEIRRHQAIRRGIRHIDETKIFVNVDGIRDSLDDTFKEKYSRLLKIVDLPHERLRRVIVALKTEGILGVDRLLVLTKSADDGLKVFTELFETLKTRYLASDEHGLDSYIGMQIRHGTMTNQLRAIFERHNFVTEESDGKYASNNYWLSQITNLDSATASVIDTQFQCFSFAVDQINEEVRTKWIQISVKQEPESALFDYYFDETSLSQLYASIEAFEPMDSLVDLIFDALTKRTEVNLSSARNRIESELEERFVSLIDALESSVEGHFPSSPRQRFRRSIEECRTDTHETCKKVASWFRLSTQHDFYDFDFEEAVRAAVDIVSSFPNFLRVPHIKIECKHKFSGGSFRSFINMLYILLENVARHAAPFSDEVSITAEESQGVLKLTVVNPLAAETDIEMLRTKVNSIEQAESFRDFREAIRSEGKSGFPKLLKILDVDLRQKEPRIKFSVDAKARRFAVSVSFNIEDLP